MSSKFALLLDISAKWSLSSNLIVLLKLGELCHLVFYFLFKIKEILLYSHYYLFEKLSELTVEFEIVANEDVPYKSKNSFYVIY